MVDFGIDFGAEDVAGWAARRTEVDLRRAAVAGARAVVPQTEPVVVELATPEEEAEAAVGQVQADGALVTEAAPLAELEGLLEMPEVLSAVLLLLQALHAECDHGESAALTGFNPEPSAETRARMAEKIQSMPESLREWFLSFTKGRTWEEAESVAAKLASEGKVDDPEKFAGFLYWSGR